MVYDSFWDFLIVCIKIWHTKFREPELTPCLGLLFWSNMLLHRNIYSDQWCISCIWHVARFGWPYLLSCYCNVFYLLLTYLLTYLLTPWSRVLLEKLTGFAASQEIPRIYGTRNFVTVLTSARHLSLSWARSIQSPPPSSTSWRSILILSSHLRLGLPNVLFTTMTLISFSYQSLNNYYVVKFVLEEASLKNGTDSVPKT
jgi:hypothetical protein